MREYLLVLLVAAGVTYVGASLARRLAFRYNAVALVRDRDVHTTPIPYFGGVAMLAGTTAALILATNLPWLGRFELVQRDAWAVFWASVLICTVGVVDDMFELGAIPKFAGQTLAAKYHYRPSRPEAVPAELVKAFPAIKLVSIDDPIFGGWKKVQPAHFDDGGIFDQIYRPAN